MFLVEPPRTQFDLKWRMFGIPVRVHPLFWIISIILGWNAAYFGQQMHFDLLGIWVGCVFISILIHELGHVLVGWFFGSRGHIVLYSMGGLAIGSSNLSNRWKRIAVSLAGPFAQFVIWLLIFATFYFYPKFLKGVDFRLNYAIYALLEINLFWPVLNLVPIWPLDGGQTSRELFTWLAPKRGLRLSLILSISVAALIALLSLLSYSGRLELPYIKGDLFLTLFFASFALNSFQELQQTPMSRRYRDEPAAPWERDPDYWKQ